MTDVVAVILMFGITAYALFGGADFGAGFWDLTAGGAERGKEPRAVISHSIGPVWEANHVWLIFCLVVLWTGFPTAFASITLTLFVPLSLAALGIVLRGSSFAFRKSVLKQEATKDFSLENKRMSTGAPSMVLFFACTTFAFVDGKKGQEYATISNLAFSEDSSHFVYQGMIGGKTFVVVDGEESDGFSNVQEFTFGGGGKRVGYIAYDNTMVRTVVVDGKATNQKTNSVSALAFSADGSRCASSSRSSKATGTCRQTWIANTTAVANSNAPTAT